MSGWARSGHLTVTPGNQQDLRRIEDDILHLCETLNVQQILFDRALATHMLQNLQHRLLPKMGQDAVEKFVMVVPQNAQTMTGAMQFVEKGVLAKTLQHDANPVMDWMISNVVVKPVGLDEVLPQKAGGKDSHNKIDGPVALFNAASAAMRFVEQPESFVLAEWY